MSGSYEIRDTDHPTWRGMRFASLARAERELAVCVGRPGRFVLVDRRTGEVVKRSA